VCSSLVGFPLILPKIEIREVRTDDYSQFVKNVQECAESGGLGLFYLRVKSGNVALFHAFPVRNSDIPVRKVVKTQVKPHRSEINLSQR